MNTRILIMVSTVLAIGFLVITLLFMNSLKQQDVLVEENRKLKETVEILQEDSIQKFIERTKMVMSGELLIDSTDEDRLGVYSFHERTYPDTDAIEASFQVLYAYREGEAVKLIVAYDIEYRDASGRLLYAKGVWSGSPVIWTIELRNGHYILVDRTDFP